MSTLELNKRECNTRNSAKKVRKQGKIPGVLYGKMKNNLMFEVGEMDLCNQIKQNGQYGIMEVDYDGAHHKALVKEIQRDPVTNKIIHLDLEEIEGRGKIVSNVPIHYVGEEFINKKGVVLQKERDSVKVEAPIDALPKFINIDIGKGNVGEVFKFGDLEVASEISIMDDLNSVIASVIYERKTVSDDMEEAEEE